MPKPKEKFSFLRGAQPLCKHKILGSPESPQWRRSNGAFEGRRGNSAFALDKIVAPSNGRRPTLWLPISPWAPPPGFPLGSHGVPWGTNRPGTNFDTRDWDPQRTPGAPGHLLFGPTGSKNGGVVAGRCPQR